MTRLALFTTLSLLVACGGGGSTGSGSGGSGSSSGSGGDLCHVALSAAMQIEAEYNCPNDAGVTITPLDAGAALIVCEAKISACSASDQANLSEEYTCYENLPPYQCKWASEGIGILSDPSATTYLAEATICENIALDAGARVSAACQAVMGTSSSGGSSGGSSGSSGGSSSGNTSWTGTYAVSNADFSDGTITTPLPSTAETLTQTGTSVTWTNFGDPSIPSCTLTVTPTGTNADLSTQTCGGWTLASGSNATLVAVTPQEVYVSVSGNDPDGGFFFLDYTLTAN